MSVEKFTISRDDSVYECFPSLTMCANGRIVLAYRESDSHVAKEFTRLIVRVSDDGGKTFSDRKVLVETRLADGVLQKWNCPKVRQVADGRVIVVCDRFPIREGDGGMGDDSRGGKASNNAIFTSRDNGDTWSAPRDTGVNGIMPDEIIELDNGDWLLATQFHPAEFGNTMQCVSRSTDKGKTWGPSETIAAKKGLNLCEASILKLPEGRLICYMRENSGKGLPTYKSISTDNGKTWKGPFETLMGGGHRPVAHLTKSGKVLISYRYQPGGAGWWAKNTFAYIESVESALETDRSKQKGIVLPLDHDRSPKSDGGYTGWVETEPGVFLVVNYIVDDAPKAQIRGYWVRESEF